MDGQNENYKIGDRIYGIKSLKTGTVVDFYQNNEKIYEVGRRSHIMTHLLDEKIVVKWDGPKDCFNRSINKLDVMEVEVEREEIALIDFKYHIRKANGCSKREV